MSVNRHDGSENNDNVYYTSYTQKLDQNTQLNTDVQKDINLWYTDLDPEAKAELFKDESDAILKAKTQLSFFPTECVQLFAFYYTIDEGQLQAMENLCQIIPKGENHTGGNSAAGLREVTRKHLKWLYDKVDFVRIRRPKNTIKWYEVSKDELNDYLSIIQQFYGLTNFPDKEGDYYFSKKIGKWLATDYFKSHSEWTVIDLAEWEEGHPVEVKSMSILDYIIAFFQGLGKKIFGFLGSFFDKNKWDSFIEDIFDNDIFRNLNNFNQNRLEELRNGTFFNGQENTINNLFTFDFSELDGSSRGTDTLFDWYNKAKEAVANAIAGFGIPSGQNLVAKINERLDKIKNGLFSSTNQQGWFASIWRNNRVLKWLQTNLGWFTDQQDDDNNNS